MTEQDSQSPHMETTVSNRAYHIPALLPECLRALDIKPHGTYVDATYGGGGHSRAIISCLEPQGHLYGFDQDLDAVERAVTDPRFTMVWSNFRFIENFMRYHGVEGVDGVLADLGVSFHHFDDTARGFTFRDHAAPLDMRMNRKSSLTAAQILETYDTEKLCHIFKLYGELQGAHKFAAAIVKARATKPMNTAGDLLNAIEPLVNKARQKKELAQVFQALRIVVNDEISVLRHLLTGALKVLKPGGRLAIITYHSLEDRLVKNFMRTGNLDGTLEKDFFGNVNSPLKLLNSKPIIPSPQEIETNPRSRSAKLRVAVKL